jgi:hypothetical protein
MRHLTLLLALATISANADIRIPPPVQKRAEMRIVHDSVGKDGPVLDIPAALANSEVRADIRPPFPVPTGNGGWYDIVSGFFLSIGAFFAGRSLWRRRKAPTKLIVPGAILLGGFLLWTESSQAQRPATIAQAAPFGDLKGPVTLRIVRGGNEIVLHLPPLDKR